MSIISKATIDSISINCKATLAHYIQALAKQFHNWFNQYQLQSNNWFDQYQLQSNLGALCTSTGKAISQSIRSVSTAKQPRLTTYKHWQSSFTIDSISINSEATTALYPQALAKQFHNQFDQYRLRSNLNSLPTWTQVLGMQFHNQFDQYQLQSNLGSLRTSTGKAVL